MTEGAHIDWRRTRWRLERRQDDVTEWRAMDGSMRHTQLTDRAIAEAVCSGEMRLHNGHGRSPTVLTDNTSVECKDAKPSDDDLAEAERKLEFVLEVRERGLLQKHAGTDAWQKAIDTVWDERARHWLVLRGADRGQAVSKKPSIKSVRRWIEQAGPQPKVSRLISRHRHKGNRVDRVDPIVREMIDEAVDRHWLARPAIRFDDLKTIVQTAVRRLNDSLPPHAEPYRLPGDTAIQTSIDAIPPDEVVRARQGDAAHFLKFGSAEAQADPDAPLDVVELDSTPADLFVVCAQSGLPLGRPTIVICIDRCTRMVLGWFVTFEKPSVLTVMQTLRNAVMPKAYIDEMNETAGWNIRHACETFGVPRTLRIDRGMENLTVHVRQAALSIGTNRVHLLRRKSPWLKGCVERTIRTMSERLLHPAPGTSLHNSLMRMDYNPLKDAVCTTDDLDWALHKYFIDVYPREQRRSINNARAIDLWRRLTRTHPVDMVESFEELNHAFGRTDVAVPGRHGIKAHSMAYFSLELLEIQKSAAFVKALKAQGGRLKYHLDPADLGQIVVQLPHVYRHITVPVAPKWRDYATGLSLYAHRRVREYTAAEARDANDADDLLACKHELLEILRHSLRPGAPISKRQMFARIEGTGTLARSGTDSRTTARQQAKAVAPTSCTNGHEQPKCRSQRPQLIAAPAAEPLVDDAGPPIHVPCDHGPHLVIAPKRAKKGYRA